MAGPAWLGNGPFQSLDGISAFEHAVLAVEAVRPDAAIAPHRPLETEMGECARMHQFADRKVDRDIGASS
jgi:hypothetical protein